jgi:hypothetical protein
MIHCLTPLRIEMFQTEVVEKIKTHLSNSITSSENSVIYAMIWKNMVGPDRPQMANNMT